jgi:putative hydroxymethylpyrimidine transport system substrate-binding protein
MKPRGEKGRSSRRCKKASLTCALTRSWQAFAAAHPELNTELNKQAWLKTLPLFASDPAALDKPRYEAYEQFLYNNKLVKKVTPLTNYAVELH